MPAQRHDSIGAEPLIDGIETGALIADPFDKLRRGFDNNCIRQELNAPGALAVIPPKTNRASHIACDFAIYKWRHLVENFFCDLKQFRSTATRYDKTDESFASMIHLAAIKMTLK